MMTPEQVTQIVETIKTLNLNIDSNSLVEITRVIKPILWTIVLEPYFKGVVAIILVLGLSKMIYQISKDATEQSNKQSRNRRVEEVLNGFGSWESIEKLSKKINEVLEYMPRNKKRRKTED